MKKTEIRVYTDVASLDEAEKCIDKHIELMREATANLTHLRSICLELNAMFEEKPVSGN